MRLYVVDGGANRISATVVKGGIHVTGVGWGLRGGVHYPRSVGELQAWFRTDADCLDYLEGLRWPAGFVCCDCGHAGGWRLGDGRFECAGCQARTSTTAGTIFNRTRTPLTVWFTACWMFANDKGGICALSLQRALEIGSYQTAWTMLHRLRSVLVRSGRERLAGTVEVGETFIGGREPGLRGRPALGTKVPTGIAVEIRGPKGLGRCGMAPLADPSATSLHAFVTDHVEPGATVITDAWPGYRGLDQLGYVHHRRSQRAANAGIHRACSVHPRTDHGEPLTSNTRLEWRSPNRYGPAVGACPPYVEPLRKIRSVPLPSSPQVDGGTDGSVIS